MLSFSEWLREWKKKNGRERALMIAGAFFLLLAVIGIFLPIVPQVPFAVIGAVLFSRSSKKFHHKIRDSRYFGKAVCDWEDHRVIRPKLKITSIVFMLAACVMGHFRFPLEWALALDGIFVLSIVFVLTRASEPKADQARA